MKKLIVGALAIYGGVKLGEKLLKKYREPIAEWVGKKAKEVVINIMKDKKSDTKPTSYERKYADYHRPYSDYKKMKSECGRMVEVEVTPKMDYMVITNLTLDGANDIIQKLENAIETFDKATTIDLQSCLYADLPAECFGYGWLDLSNVNIIKTSHDRWTLFLPNMVKL